MQGKEGHAVEENSMKYRQFFCKGGNSHGEGSKGRGK